MQSFNPSNNPNWSPSLNKYVIVHIINKKSFYAGKVIKIVDDRKLALIHLVVGKNTDQNVKNYIDDKDDYTKYMTFSKDDGWRYVDDDKIKLLNKLGSIQDLNLLVKREELLFDEARPNGPKLTDTHLSNATDEPLINQDLIKLIELENLDDFSFLSYGDYDNKETLQNELKIDTTSVECEIEENISKKVKENRKCIIDLLEGKKKKEQQKQKKESQYTYQEQIEELRVNINKPLDFLPIDTTMILSFVENEEALKREALKIIGFLKHAFYVDGPEKERNEDKLYGSLRFVYYNGYVHIFRTEIPLKENITSELLQGRELKVQKYDEPINHNVLKHILFQNNTQDKFKVDKELREEAEFVLSQEYIIALTPEPRYLMWCVYRLIKIWFGDVDLQNNIRKIKILVNQYRARSDKEFNIHNGIKFSIGIYPRYGKTSATIVLKRVMFYFMLYIQAVGWRNNPPSYFKIVNDLISYTNSNQSLKLYYRRILHEQKLLNRSFTPNYTLINNPDTDILSQYVP